MCNINPLSVCVHSQLDKLFDVQLTVVATLGYYTQQQCISKFGSCEKNWVNLKYFRMRLLQRVGNCPIMLRVFCHSASEPVEGNM